VIAIVSVDNDSGDDSDVTGNDDGRRGEVLKWYLLGVAVVASIRSV
jgi:hypothetical protein